MLLSVVMAAFNAEKHIKEAIDSILKQSYTDFEFIIINDGSTDNTLEIIKSYNDHRIKIINQRNAGLSKSLNNGIAIANGRFIARIDADDSSLPHRLEKQLEVITKHSDIVLLGANAHMTDEDGNYLYTSSLENSIEHSSVFETSNPFFHSSVVFKKTVFDKCGGYNEEVIHHFEDKLLWAKMFAHGKLLNLEEALINYRITPNSISNKTKEGFILQKKISNAYLNGNEINAEEYQRFLDINKISTSKKYALYYNRIAKIHLFKHKNKEKAIQNAFLSFKRFPFNLGALKVLAYTIFITKTSKNQNIQ